MRLLIGTPAYGGMVHLDYLNSLLEFQKKGLDFSLASIGNESLITRARNTVLSYFYHQRDQFSHLLFLDADIHLPAAGLKRLLDYRKDVVGAAVPAKAYGPDGRPRLNSSGLKEEVAPHLYTTRYLATAVMLLSKEAVVALVEDAIAAGKIYRNHHGYDSKENVDEMEMYDVFQVGVVDGVYLSEDYWLCRELKRLGFDAHITDSIQVTHYGTHGFRIPMRPAPNQAPATGK
jgi:hypothetical protein